MGDASEAEDVLQESYVRAFYAFATYTGAGSLGGWLARIVRNEAIDRLRARDSRRSHVAIEADLGEQGEQPREEETNVMIDPQALAANAEWQRLLEQAIHRLPEQFRTAFVLREVEGLSVDETAEYLGIPAATVKTTRPSCTQPAADLSQRKRRRNDSADVPVPRRALRPHRRQRARAMKM
jgi:RNA polymerase sigma-70 factor (ECF subfamily)